MKISIIIPIYNEEKTLEKVVLGVARVFEGKDFEIIIVNDGSTDGTAEIISKIKNSRIQTVSHDRNYGKGRAIQSGLEKAKGDYIAIQDADLEYNPETLYELYKNCGSKASAESVIYGKRKGDKGYLFNRIGNRILSLVCNILFSSKLSDIYTCYKIIPRKLMQELDLKSNGFEIEAEVTAKILKRKINILEISIPYSPRTFREGKKINWRDGYRGIIILIKTLWWTLPDSNW